MKVIKRNGQYETFNSDKIKRAMLMAFAEVGEADISEVEPMVERVRFLMQDEGGRVEDVQTTVEEVLADYGYVKVARAYIKYRVEKDLLRERRLKPDATALMEYIHVAKYARWRPEMGRREVYHETVDRVKMMHIQRFQHLGAGFIGEIETAFSYVYARKVLPSMRSMQFAGPAIERNHARLYNCTFTPMDRIEAFGGIMFLLLSGCGCGYSVQWHHVENLPAVKMVDKSKVRHHTIADTIEGWGEAVKVMMECYMIEGVWPEYNYSLIRPRGAELKTSGGKAPGHLPLRECLEHVRNVLEGSQGRKIRPIEVHDIVCYLAEAVLAGGIRRSSLMSLFSLEDTEMMYAKARGVFNPSGLNSQRMMANNSVVLNRHTVKEEDFKRVVQLAADSYGEPGFFFTNDINYGTNPCAEIGLNPWDPVSQSNQYGFCNLTEINVAAISDADEYYQCCKAASFIGTLQASYTDVGLGPDAKRVLEREALLGVSMTGIMDAPWLLENMEVMREGARRVVAVNEDTASRIGINCAARCTTVKPSGTASLALGGVGSGIHPHHARRYFRRVTANPLEPQAQYFRSVNPHMVEVKPNGDWALVFCVEASSEAVLVKDVDALKMLSIVSLIYKNWVLPGTARVMSSPGLTHNVSATVVVKDEEREQVIDYIWNNRQDFAALSFVSPTLDKMYPYAPREAVVTIEDEHKWNNIIEGYRKVKWEEFVEERDETDLTGEAACSGGSCEI